jgi:Fe-S oxidoreductase
MKEIKDEVYRKWAWNCYRESMCKGMWPWHVRGERFSIVCPSLSRYKFDAYSAQGRLDIARAIIEDELEPQEAMLEPMYHCTLCGGCDYICGRIKEMNPNKIIQAVRNELVRTGTGPIPGFKPILDNIAEASNPYGKANSTRTEWISGLYSTKSGGKTSSTESISKTDTILYAGCIAMKGPEFHKIPQNAVSILQRAGIDVGILGEREKCCGNPALRIGDFDQFTALAKENIKQFNESGVKRVVCACSFCYGTLKRDYPEVAEVNFEVIHIVELVDQLIKEGSLKLRKPINSKVTWHDPCHLGRKSYPGMVGTGSFGIYQPPRDILSSIPGLTLVEMERTKDDGFCCGGGSWMLTGNPEFAQWSASERLEEARASTAEAVVTCCPHCEENFNQSLESQGNNMKLYDLLELVLQSL